MGKKRHAKSMGEMDMELAKKSPALALAKDLMQGGTEPNMLQRLNKVLKQPPRLDPQEAREITEKIKKMTPEEAVADVHEVLARQKKLDAELALIKDWARLMDKKRKPTLADLYLLMRGENYYHSKQTAFVRDSLLEAKRFVLDKDAALYFAEMCRDVPEAIAYGQDFAIPPFQKMWIEMPYREFYETTTGEKSDGNGDTRTGYLFVGPRVYCVASAVRDGVEQAGLSPIVYRLNQPFSQQEEFEAAVMMNTSRLGMDFFYWGTSADKWVPHTQPKTEEGRRLVIEAEVLEENRYLLHSLRANHSWQWTGDPEYIKEGWAKLYEGSAGDLRIIIGLLYYMNQTSMIRYEDEIGHARIMLGNKPKTLVKHSVVHLKLNPVPDIRKRLLTLGTTGRHHREHDVRGHFCHNEAGRSLTCNHDWLETKVNQWRCLACEGLRWWKREHRRGKKKEGHVETTYEVHE